MMGEVLKLKKGTLRWRAFKLLRESPKALFGYEIVEQIPGMKYYSLQSTLNFLLDENLIVMSGERYSNEKRGRAFLFAINEALVKARIKELRNQHMN